MLKIPDTITDEFIQQLKDEGYTASEIKIIKQGVKKKQAEARSAEHTEEIKLVREEHPNTEIAEMLNRAAETLYDPDKAIRTISKMLNTVIDQHIKPKPSDPLKKSGKIKTIVDYIRMQIYIIDGIEMSHMPIYSLRKVGKAENCGVSLRNGLAIHACLHAILNSDGAVPLGNEEALSALLADMTTEAELERKRLVQLDDKRQKAKDRAARLRKARKTFLPQVSLYKDMESLSGEQKARDADRGSRDAGEEELAEILSLENKELIKKLTG